MGKVNTTHLLSEKKSAFSLSDKFSNQRKAGLSFSTLLVLRIDRIFYRFMRGAEVGGFGL